MKIPVSEHLILNSSSIILRIAINSLGSIGMAEALVDGHYPDLVGLINPKSIGNEDLVLLQQLDVPKFNTILDTVLQMHDYIEKYLMIKNLDEDECEEELGAVEFAQDFFRLFAWPISKETDYWETRYVYISVLAALDSLIKLQIDREFDLSDEDLVNVFRDWLESPEYTSYPEPQSSDSVVGIWYDLYLDIEAKYKDIMKFEEERWDSDC